MIRVNPARKNQIFRVALPAEEQKASNDWKLALQIDPTKVNLWSVELTVLSARTQF
jgi:hypothetical protein